MFKNSLPLAIGAGGLALFGFLSLSNRVARNAAPDSGASGGPVATHADTNRHASNMQSFADGHAEAIVTATGRVTIYLYGKETARLRPIPAVPLDTEALPFGEDSVPIKLAARPLKSDPAGMSSRFSGSFDRRPDQTDLGLSAMIPLAGHTYRVQWRSESLIGQTGDAHASDIAMPAAKATDEAAVLFSTPGGKYTAADIAVNGPLPASKKFGGKMSAHNMNPAAGAPICPITNTAASPRFAWQVNGKTYLFCCPPCVEEFVQRAKTKPESILAPEEYVKK